MMVVVVVMVMLDGWWMESSSVWRNAEDMTLAGLAWPGEREERNRAAAVAAAHGLVLL